jgi:hypothetical protein
MAGSTSDSKEFSEIDYASPLFARSKPMPWKTLLKKWKQGSFLRLRSGLISGLSLGKTSATSTWFREVFRASHSRLPVAAPETKTQDTCSPTSSMDCAVQGLPLFSWKTSKESCQPSSLETAGEILPERPFCSMSSASWKEWVTAQRLEYSARLKSGLPTNANASLSGGSWPTITVNESKNSGTAQEDRNTLPLGTIVGLPDQGNLRPTGNPQGSADLWQTPDVGSTAGGRTARGQSEPHKTSLERQAKHETNWPTASTSDAEGGPQPLITMTPGGFRCEKVNRPGEFFGAKLRDAVETHEKNWSTPISGDWKGQKKADGTESMLCAQVTKPPERWATPQASDHVEGARTAPDSNQKCLGRDLQWLTPRATEAGVDKGFVERNGDRGEHCHPSLSSQVADKGWVTPKSSDAKFPGKSRDVHLTHQAEAESEAWSTPRAGESETWGTPTARDHKSGRGNQDRQYKELTAEVERGAAPKARLNPRWVETLMGVPAGWVKCGEGNRTDELRLLGNGVVPATACRAWQVLSSR